MYENSMDKKTGILSIVAAFAVGSLIGAGLALLMAPQSGAETRSMLADNASDMKDKAVGALEDTRDKANKTVDDVSKKTKGKAAELKDKVKSQVSDKQDQLNDQVKAAKKSMGY